jgi:hypothetical protein
MPMFFSPNSDRTSESAKAVPARRHSTTISMMEQEFGMREPPQAVTRFGRKADSLVLLSHSPSDGFSSGLASRLRIVPQMRKRSYTQAPEPRRNSSFLKGPWEIMWGCDADEAYLVESSPDEEVDSPSDEVLGKGVQEYELDQNVATPTGDASWCAGGETTPTFSSNFPTQPDSEDLRCDSHPDESYGSNPLENRTAHHQT